MACYLINHMSTSILQGEFPFSFLYPKCTPFPFSPRVFGCICFVHVLGPSHDKLASHAIKCIFLGYSPTWKAYHCIDPITWHQYVSADVTFFESTPYFTKESRSLNLNGIPKAPSPHEFSPHELTTSTNIPLSVRPIPPLSLVHFCRYG